MEGNDRIIAIDVDRIERERAAAGLRVERKPTRAELWDMIGQSRRDKVDRLIAGGWTREAAVNYVNWLLGPQ